MKAFIKNVVRWLIDVLPDRICQLLFPVFSRIIDESEVQERALARFTDRLIKYHDQIIPKIVNKGRVMYIKKIIWPATYFNIAVLHNIMGLVMYCLYLGYIPIIQINEEDDNSFSWWWFFKQPLENYTQNLVVRSQKVLDKTNVSYGSGWIYNQSGEQYRRWRYIYQSFVWLNDRTKEYINSENAQIGDLDTVLGVLVRGTDYIATKPKGHPIQPELDEVIERARQVIGENNYRAVYVATEDESYYDTFMSEFGKERVLSNKRVYYDKKYVPGKVIGIIHFDRDNDNYLKSIEYLSSMILLSRCDSLVAGNCGGTRFSLLYAQKPFLVCDIFDKGLYE